MSKGHSETTNGQISSLEGIFSPVSRMHGHVLMKLITVSHYLGMSEKREYAIVSYLALCRIFRIF